MKAIKLMEKLRTKPVFRTQDIERIAFCSKGYAKLTISRLVKAGLIKRVATNAYTAKDNIFVISSNLVYPSYISFWSASAFLGYTEQIPHTVYVATTRRVRRVAFEGYGIVFVPMKKHFFGYRKIATAEGDIFMAEDEKLLIDAFLRPEKCGNFGEIDNIFRKSKVTEEKMVSYLKATGTQSIMKRVGYLLEKTKGMDLSHQFKLDRNYVQLDPFSAEWKTTDKKWRVRI